MKGSRWCIGNGRSVHIWEDGWIPKSESFRVVSPRGPQGEAVMVSDLLDAEKRSWDVAKVKSILLPHEAELVLSILSALACRKTLLSGHGPPVANSQSRVHMVWRRSGRRNVATDLNQEVAQIIQK